VSCRTIKSLKLTTAQERLALHRESSIWSARGNLRTLYVLVIINHKSNYLTIASTTAHPSLMTSPSPPGIVMSTVVIQVLRHTSLRTENSRNINTHPKHLEDTQRPKSLIENQNQEATKDQHQRREEKDQNAHQLTLSLRGKWPITNTDVKN